MITHGHNIYVLNTARIDDSCRRFCACLFICLIIVDDLNVFRIIECSNDSVLLRNGLNNLSDCGCDMKKLFSTISKRLTQKKKEKNVPFNLTHTV